MVLLAKWAVVMETVCFFTVFRSAAHHGGVLGHGCCRDAVWKHCGRRGIFLGGEPHPACVWTPLPYGRYTVLLIRF